MQPFAHGVLRDFPAIAKAAAEGIAKYDVRAPSPSVSASTLSGGNQQKLVVAREFDRALKLLILDQPTRGLDVGSIEFIHRQALRMRDEGTAILLVSAELDEVLEMSDRIAVMYRGGIVDTVDGRTADKNVVGLLMATGARPARRPRRPASPGPARHDLARGASRAGAPRPGRTHLADRWPAARVDPARPRWSAPS